MIGFRGVRIFVRLRLFASAQKLDHFNSVSRLTVSFPAEVLEQIKFFITGKDEAFRTNTLRSA